MHLRVVGIPCHLVVHGGEIAVGMSHPIQLVFKPGVYVLHSSFLVGDFPPRQRRGGSAMNKPHDAPNASTADSATDWRACTRGTPTASFCRRDPCRTWRSSATKTDRRTRRRYPDNPYYRDQG